jgi:D-3-phosphoglycerate dehydrogenase
MSELVVITDCDHGGIDPEVDVLSAAGIEVRLEQAQTSEQVAAASVDAGALIVQYATVDGPALDQLPACQAIIRYGVGVDTIDVEAATQRGVWVVNVPDYGVEEVSDHTLALALDLVRGVTVLNRSVREGGWDYRIAAGNRRLSTLTLGVVGQGRIGRSVAVKGAGLGMRVLGYDVQPSLISSPVEPATLDGLLAQSDVVCLHAPLTPDTQHMIDAAALALMRPTAFLVNTARGGLVDADALLDALNSGRLAGAGLDVLETEPPSGSSLALAEHPSVIVTPHSAWWSREAFHALKSEVAREAVRVLRGDAPRSPVNQPRIKTAR